MVHGYDCECYKAPRHGAGSPDLYRAGYFIFGGEWNANTFGLKKDQAFKDQFKEHDQEFEKRHS